MLFFFFKQKTADEREDGLVGSEMCIRDSFWVDFTRSTLHVLLPRSFILAVVLASQGVVQSFAPYQQVTLVEPVVMQEQTVTEQTLPLGPAASQVAIKQLGTNGGGFFNVNSAHPLENPTPLSNWLEMLAILLIFIHVLDVMLQDQKIGAFIAMQLDAVLVIPLDDAEYFLIVLKDNDHRSMSIHLLFVVEAFSVRLFGRYLLFRL